MPGTVVEALSQLQRGVSEESLITLRAELQTVPPEGLAQAWRDQLEQQAAPLVAALHTAAAAAHGPNWPEQAFDSYLYAGYEREEWSVTVPFAALPYAATAVVPVAAAERILGLPEAPPEPPNYHAENGRFYRRYWATQRRFLCLVAEIAARFPDDGGERLAAELRRRLRRLPEVERQPVELRLASLGLLQADAAALAREVLEAARLEDRGERGELVLHALDGLDGLPEPERARLLAQALYVARQTTAFVASNPYAAVVEALAEAEIASVPELVRLVDRAAERKWQDWEGWQRALLAAGRSLTHLAEREGAQAIEQTLPRLWEYRTAFPSMEATLLLAGARGLPPAEAATYARRALAAARTQRGPEAVRAEVGAGALLAELGEPDGLPELRRTATELPRRGGAARGTGLQALAVALARLDAGDGALTAEGLDAAARIREPEARWLAYAGLAAAPHTARVVAAQAYEQAARAARRWLVRRPPLDVLVPLLGGLAEALPDRPQAPVLQALAELARSAADESLTGQRFARRLMDLGPLIEEPATLLGLGQVADTLAGRWWQLPLLAMVGDAAAAWLRRIARAELRPPGAAERPVA